MVAAWLAAAESHPGNAGVFLDFDGTLAGIVEDPGSAAPWPGTADVLRRLVARCGAVAVVSGRPASFLASALHDAGDLRMLGLYGLETVATNGSVSTEPAGERYRPAVQQAEAEARRSVGEGVSVEPKGLTVTLHYRKAPEEAKAVEDLAGRLANRYGLRPHPGKMSVELRPPVEIDKGTVVRRMAEGLDPVLFAGDDTGDLPAMEELRRLRLQGRTTLTVASGGQETPAEVISAADVVVEGPAGLIALLGQVAQRLEVKGRPEL